MKKILNFIAAAAIVAGFVSCQPKTEDTFSTDPVAPELYAHSDILLTTGTPDEDVTFAWSAYRNLPKGLNYSLVASCGDDSVELVNTDLLYYKVSKAEFKEILTQNFTFPENSTANFIFKVKVEDGGKVYESEALSVNIYVNGDAVAPEFTLVMEPVVLDPTKATEEIVLAEWAEARLVYGETVTYGVAVVAGDGEPYSLTGDKPIVATSYKLTVDELNEALIAAGAPEAEETQMTVVVTAFCESLPNGIEVVSDPVAVTTFLSTFPDMVYLPGSHQGWNPAEAPTIKQSTAQKGLYEGVIDLTTDDGADAQFKFCPEPAWGNDFGGKVEVETLDSGFAFATGTVGVSDNIVVPSGVYNVVLNKKLNTLTLAQFETLSLIGSAVGDYSWGQDVDLEYNAEAKTFSAVTEFKAGEFKIRFNHDWTVSLGGELSAVGFGGGNIASTVEGEYKLVMDVSKCPYSIKFINTAFPEQVYLPGSHNSWDHSKTVLAGDGEGHYEGFLAVGGEWGFKITPAPNWDAEWGWDGVDPVNNVWGLTGTNAGNICSSNGASTELTYSKVVVDLTQLTCTVTPITSIGIIGSFPDNNWSTDAYPLTYDADKDEWKAEGVEILKNCEWKFRMNQDWAINLGPVEKGTDLSVLVQDGGNVAGVEPGVYTVVLSIATTPYSATITKTGDVDAPDYADYISVPGAYSGNSWDPATNAFLTHAGKGVYKGFVAMFGDDIQFKFNNAGAWIGGIADGVNYTLGADSNMSIAPGLYYWVVDTEAMTAKATEMTQVGLIGLNDDWGSDILMTYDATDYLYHATATANGATKFKVRFNASWDYNLGGDVNALTEGGADISVPEAGTYDFALNIVKGYPSITVTK